MVETKCTSETASPRNENENKFIDYINEIEEEMKTKEYSIELAVPSTNKQVIKLNSAPDISKSKSYEDGDNTSQAS